MVIYTHILAFRPVVPGERIKSKRISVAQERRITREGGIALGNITEKQTNPKGN